MATIKQKKAVINLVGNGGNVTKAMREAKYAEATINTPQKLTESKGFQELWEETINNDLLTKKHLQLLNSTRVDHLVFPLGPKDRAKEELDTSGMPEVVKTIFEAEQALQHTSLTDEEITEMLAEVNCKVRRIVHGETARHVYFWSADNKALKDALDMAYKLKGSYAPTESKSLQVNVEARISNPKLKTLNDEYNEKIFEMLKDESSQ